MMVSPEPTEPSEEDYRALFVKPDLEVRNKKKVCPFCLGPKRCRKHDAEVLGVLTGQVPVRSMPVAMNEGEPDEETDADEPDA